MAELRDRGLQVWLQRWEGCVWVAASEGHFHKVQVTAFETFVQSR